MNRTEEENLKNAKFNHEKLLKHLQEVNDSLPDIDSDAFLNAILEFVKIFGVIGSAFSFAFKGNLFFLIPNQLTYKRYNHQSCKHQKQLC